MHLQLFDKMEGGAIMVNHHLCLLWRILDDFITVIWATSAGLRRGRMAFSITACEQLLCVSQTMWKVFELDALGLMCSFSLKWELEVCSSSIGKTTEGHLLFLVSAMALAPLDVLKYMRLCMVFDSFLFACGLQRLVLFD